MGFFQFFSKKQSETPPVKAKTILVVDDEQYLREFYEELLKGEGFTVITAANGEEGLQKVAQIHPDLILLDLMMPVMDGKQVLHKLSDNPATKSIPVIVLTNAGSIENMENAKYYSAYRFFIKSNVAPEEIIRTVKETFQLITTHTS